MRREYKSTELTKEQVGEVWKEIYSKYPEIYDVLLKARRDNEPIQEYITTIFELFRGEDAKAIAEEYPIKDRLYKYWTEAGLEGTPSQFFSKFIVDSGLDYFNYEKYDFSKTPWDSANTKVARNNVLIDLIQGRLSDPDTIVTRTTPGGFNTAKKASYRMKDLMGIDDANYDYTEPMTLVKFNQQNQVADKLIGIFANHNSHHAMISNVVSCSLETPISFAGKTLFNLKNPHALTKELLAASVDAVKDPVLNFLNLNPITANSGALLCRLGFSFEDIGLLLNQPIIKKVCDYCVDNNIYDIDIAINKVSKDLGITDIDRKAENTNKLLSKDFLESSIVGFYKEGGIINTVQQKAVIQLFKEIYATAQELSSFVTNTKFTASNSVPSTIGGLYTQQLKVFKYFYDNKKPGRRINTQIDMYNTQDIIAIDQNIKDKEDYIKYFMMHPFGYEQAMYDSNMEAIKLLNKYYPYDKPTFVQARDLASNICIGDLDEDTINDIHNFIIEYLLSNIEDSIFNPDFLITDESGENKMTAKEYYTKMVPVLIKNLIKEGNHPCVYSEILQSLEFIESNDGKSLIMRISRVGNLGLTKKDAIRESWEDLLNDPNTKPIAIALYMYSYYTSGFGFGNIGFNHLAPLELKMILEITTDKSLSYTQFLEELMTNDKAGIIDFLHLIKNFIKKHPDNTKFVYTPIGNTLGVLNTLVYTRNGIEDIIEIDVSNSKSNTYKSLKKCIIGQDKETGITKFKPALMIGDELYIAIGTENSLTFETKSGKMKYARVKNEESDFDYSKYLKYDNSEETNKEDTESPSEKPSDKIPVYTLEELYELSPEDIIENIVDHDIILGELMIEDRKSGITSWKQQYQEALLGLTKESVKGMLIEVLQERYKKEGVVDSEGNLIC